MEFERIKTPKEFLEYMNNNITYGFIGKNGKKYQNFSSEEWFEEGIVQNGEEVLKSKIGTCYDQVELERLWFGNHHFEVKTIFIWFEVDYENDYPTHTFLVYKNNHKWYWFEHAFEPYRGIHEFDSDVKLGMNAIEALNLDDEQNKDAAQNVKFSIFAGFNDTMGIKDGSLKIKLRDENKNGGLPDG